MDYMLEVSQLQKTVDEFQLGPIDLKIEPGTITALVGNNGSGKSTLLKCIMDLVTPNLGLIKFNNETIYHSKEDWKKSVAYQPQTIIGWNPYNGKTLKQLIAPLYPSWDEALFTKMVEAFEIPLNKKFGKLSQGVQQKLSLALTISRNAPLLILDEPTSFMDIPSKKVLMDILVEWMEKEENRSIIIASHQVEDIRKLSDYLFVLHDGDMIGHFEKEELTTGYKKFWLKNELPSEAIPGEVARHSNQIISKQPEATEDFFKEENIAWTEVTSLDLEEIISLLLSPNK